MNCRETEAIERDGVSRKDLEATAMIRTTAVCVLLVLVTGCASFSPQCKEFELEGVQIGGKDNQNISGYACPSGKMDTWEAHQDLPLTDLLKTLIKGL